MSVKALREALAALPAAADAAVPDAEAPAVLAALAAEVRELESGLVNSKLQVQGAQASLTLLLPAGVDPEHYGVWAAGAEQPPEDGFGRAAAALAEDARMYVAFDRMRVALAALHVHNQRFGTVIDLMAAATHLLEPSTYVLAIRLVRSHVAQCRAMLGELDAALQATPRLFDAAGHSFLGALN